MPTQKASLDFLADPDLTAVDPAVVEAMNQAMISRGDGPSSPFPGSNLQAPTSKFPAPNRFAYTPAQLQEMANQIDQAAQEPPAEAPAAGTPAEGTPVAGTDGNEQGQDTPPVNPTDTPPVTPTAPVAPAADGAPTPEPTEQGGFKFKVGDQEVELSEQQATYLLSLNQWLEEVPAETKQAWAAIQQGTHSVIPQDELTQFKAWQALGSPKAQDVEPDLSDLTPEQAAYVENLKKIAAPVLNPEPPAPVAPPVSVQAQQLAQQQIQLQADRQTVVSEFATKYSLTPEQIAQMEQATIQSQLIAQIDMQSRQYSPTGALISRAPFSDVLRRAFDVTMATDPALKQVRDDALYNERLAAENAANQQTNGKKAAAASLSALQPAAVTSGAPQTGPQTMQQTMAGIASMLREAEANGTIGQ